VHQSARFEHGRVHDLWRQDLWSGRESLQLPARLPVGLDRRQGEWVDASGPRLVQRHAWAISPATAKS
jgi:hypothetical protein